MQQEAVRWNIKVSKETDLNLRTFFELASRVSSGRIGDS